MESCCADNCDVATGEGYTLHKFPEKELLRRAWVYAMNRRGFVPTKYSKLCSKHFTNDSYEEDDEGYRVLKPDALPSIFNFRKSENTGPGVIQCFVPGCTSIYSEHLIKTGIKCLHMFRAPIGDIQFAKWKKILSTPEKEYTRDDQICELHFKDTDVEKFYNITTAMGLNAKVEKTKPTLRKGAFPKICLKGKAFVTSKVSKTTDKSHKAPSKTKRDPVADKYTLLQDLEKEKFDTFNHSDEEILLQENISVVNKRASLLDSDNSKPKKIKSFSIEASEISDTSENEEISVQKILSNVNKCASFSNSLNSDLMEVQLYGVSPDDDQELSNDADNEAILEEETEVSSVNNHLTYQDILKNLQLIKKPNSWWNIAPFSSFIICARWNEKYSADKRANCFLFLYFLKV